MKTSVLFFSILLAIAFKVNAQAIQSPVVMNNPKNETFLTKEERKAQKYNRIGHRSPGVAFALSFVVPGAGQFYNRQPVKGAAFLTSSLVGYGLVMSSISDMFDYYDNSSDRKALAGLSLIMVSWLASAIDAPLSAKAINSKYQLDFGYRQMNGYLPTGNEGSGVFEVKVGIPIGKSTR